MQYLGLAVVVAVLAALILGVSLRILLGGNWLLGFVRGMLGLVVLALGGLVGLIAYDLANYRSLPTGAPLATVTFHGQGNGLFDVQVRQADASQTVLVEGDLWQLQVRVLKWKGLAALIGLEPGYRLERLNGRYLAVEQQTVARLQNARLSPVAAKLDLWEHLAMEGRDFWLLEPQPQRSDRIPMADGATFEVSLAPTGLLVEPTNDQARQALAHW